MRHIPTILALGDAGRPGIADPIGPDIKSNANTFTILCSKM